MSHLHRSLEAMREAVELEDWPRLQRIAKSVSAEAERLAAAANFAELARRNRDGPQESLRV